MHTTYSFCVLGPLLVHGPGGEVRLSGNRQRILLTMLSLEANRVIEGQRLIQGIWGDTPPLTARSQLRICVSSLRRQFEAGQVPAAIETHKSGYEMRIARGEIDLHCFENQIAYARAEARSPVPSECAVKQYREALALWRGPIGAGLGSDLLDSIALKFHEDRYAALEERFELELLLGQHRRILGELAHHVAEHPFRETLSAQLMIALFRSGRTADALSLFRQTRRRFCEDLGIEPGERLRAIERAILNGDTDGGLLGSVAWAASPAPYSPEPVRTAETVGGGLTQQDRISLLEEEIALLRAKRDRT